jgi:hypothetical protein
VLAHLKILVPLLVLSELPIRVVVLARLQILAPRVLAQRQPLVFLFAEPLVLARAHLLTIFLLTLLGQLQSFVLLEPYLVLLVLAQLQILVLLEPHLALLVLLVLLVLAQLQIPVGVLAPPELGKTALINVRS